MNIHSIRFRLTIWYAGLLAVGFLFLGMLIYGGVELYLNQAIAKVQIRRAQQIANTLLAKVDKTGEAYVANEINSWFAPETNDRFIRITREGSGIVYLSKLSKDSGMDPATVPVIAPSPRKSSWRIEKKSLGAGFLVAAVTYLTPDGKYFLVEVGASLEPVREVLHRLVILLLLTMTAMLAAAIFGGGLLVKKALKPVGEISDSAEHISLHNLKERLPAARTGDELERLSVSLNNMIKRMDDALQHNQRFVADASHELRTPLTIMRGELEAMVNGQRIIEDMRPRATSILEEVERLSRIVESLFAISRLDAGEMQREPARFNLASLATNTTEQMCLLAEDKEIGIACDAPGEVLVDGDRSRIKQVIVNLLDNAIKYTPPQGKVNLSVRAMDNKAVLQVEDNGIGIPTEAEPHIFERFYRVDKARTRELGGAGLGLSIVKSICAAHGGSVHFKSVEGEGSCFKVELPLANEKTTANL